MYWCTWLQTSIGGITIVRCQIFPTLSPKFAACLPSSLGLSTTSSSLDKNYYQARANFGLGRLAAAKRHAGLFMKLRKENPTNTRIKKAWFLLFDELEMNSILGDEKAVLENGHLSMGQPG